ncbi:MAG TPA: ABC transporter permease [Noviherbaspirillum sp.]|uniref:ABC transporter permease n=1 Tax=Noviherbaspirillum sp. TaxID=1926288 RepID=UPI002B46597C|nr:ABC transporter permease [Noviherbaspirillum sp.]HJV83850.1 ABC transporter permease [Noviherbaspirillum sp.]
MDLSDSVRDAFSLLLSGDGGLWQVVWVSLKTSLLGMLVAGPPALLLGYFIGTRNFAGRRIVILLTQAALSLPTVLIGLLLYMMLSRRGPLGSLQWLFTQSGIVFGDALILLPLLVALTLSAVQATDPRLAETAVAHGASGFRLMCTVLHEARFGVMVAAVNGFGRIISEVGCALMVGGNIAGDTRTMPTAIALETSKGEFAQGIALGIVLMAIALFINAAMLLLQGNAKASLGA